jgi:hypothetical protein
MQYFGQNAKIIDLQSGTKRKKFSLYNYLLIAFLIIS